MKATDSPPLAIVELAPDDSVAEIYERTHARLVQVAGLLVGDADRAADVVADVFVGFIAAAERGPIENSDAYLRRAVVNAAIGRGRRREVRRRHAHRIRRSAAENDRTAQVDLELAMWESLCRLRVRDRALLVLRYYEDMSLKDVAEHLDMPMGTVKSGISRALARLGTDMDRGN